jgi:hypothetical protein
MHVVCFLSAFLVNLFAFHLPFLHSLCEPLKSMMTETPPLSSEQKRLPYAKLPDESHTSPCLVVYLSDTESELLSYDYFVGGTRRGQEIELRFSSATVGARLGDAHDAQEILEWAGGKRLYSLTAIPSECIIDVVKAEEEE